MISSRILPPAIALAAPLLMAPTCVNAESAFEGRVQETYCREDVPVRVVVSNHRMSGLRPTALLGVYNVLDGKGTVLKRVRLNPGDSIVLAATIPWTQLAGQRGRHFVITADVGHIDHGHTAPGTTLTWESYDAALGGTTLRLFSRATRSFTICKR